MSGRVKIVIGQQSMFPGWPSHVSVKVQIVPRVAYYLHVYTDPI